MSKQKPDYGLNGPGVVRAIFIVGLAGTIVGFLLERWTLSRHAGATVGLAHAVQIFGFFCLIVASLMFTSSRFGKLHARDRLLTRLKLRGDETVLDVGYGPP